MIFKIRKRFVRKKKKLERECEKMLKTGGLLFGKMSDIFGNITFYQNYMADN